MRQTTSAAQQLPSNGAMSCNISWDGKSWLSPSLSCSTGKKQQHCQQNKGRLHLAVLQLLQVVAQPLLLCTMPGLQIALQLVKEAVLPSMLLKSLCSDRRAGWRSR